MLCPHCKTSTLDNAAFCHACGAALGGKSKGAATNLLPADPGVPDSHLPLLPVIARVQPGSVQTPSGLNGTGLNAKAFDLRDVWPEVRQGAIRGAIVGGIGGPLLGAIAGIILHGYALPGALRGLLAALVGAGAGAVVGLLRALPHAAPSSGASSQGASSHNILYNGVRGAGEGAGIGALLGALLVLQGFLGGPLQAPANPLTGLLLFGFAGAIGGAIVSIIQAIPRDRRHRRPPSNPR